MEEYERDDHTYTIIVLPPFYSPLLIFMFFQLSFLLGDEGPRICLTHYTIITLIRRKGMGGIIVFAHTCGRTRVGPFTNQVRFQSRSSCNARNILHTYMMDIFYHVIQGGTSH